MSQPQRNLYLVDGSGYIFRAFFGLPQLNNSRGLPTNATYGFIRMLLKLLKETRPSHIAVVFDSTKKTFRDDLFEAYKANRAETPSDLIKQIPFIYRAVDAFRIRRLVVDGYEADDVIGTLATQAAGDKFDVVIVTGDKDFMQLVGPKITLWDTMFGKRTGAREVRERFGVEPRALIEIMALMGDAVDNVKGVPGVGEKTASALIQHFGSLEGLYAGLDRIAEVKARIPRKMAAVLAEHRADAELSRKLVQIDTATPLEFAPEALGWPGIDHEAVAGLLRELEFGSLLAELTPHEAGAQAGEDTTESYVGAENLATIVAELRAAPSLAFHLGGDATGAVVLKIKAAEQPTVHVFGREQIATLGTLLANPAQSKLCHDLKRHLGLLQRYDVELAGVEIDTMIAGFLINPGRPEPPLAELYREYLAPLGAGASEPSEPAALEALREPLRAKLKAGDLERLYNEIELPVARVLAAMEAAGIGIDAAAMREISAEFGGQLNGLERECFALVGREFNLNSPTQLREILFDELKLATKGLKKTKSGFSTDADTLEKLAGAHPLARKLLEYRALAKLKSTYSDALPELVDGASGRIHTSFHQALTATGRLSSTEPNLQNIPTRSAEGRRIRRAFVPAAGHLLLSADYSQIELRILAHLSRDATLVEAFARDEDIHARTAAEVLGADPADREARRQAKVINFGIIYGMGPQRLAGELGIPFAAASDYIRRYFERLPGVKRYLDETLRGARERGYVTTMYGRRRYLPELNGPDGGARAQAERIATNTPIQGSAADLIKLAMVRLDSALREHNVAARMILQVHDELLLEVSRAALDPGAEAVRLAMEEAATLAVPLKVELKVGSNWAELKPR
ncbi:MAG: DNA polymerase I [Candidatus Binataceae bacterium]